LKVFTEIAQIPVSTDGKIFMTIFSTIKSDNVTSFKSFPISEKSFAFSPIFGKFP